MWQRCLQATLAAAAVDAVEADEAAAAAMADERRRADTRSAAKSSELLFLVDLRKTFALDIVKKYLYKIMT